MPFGEAKKKRYQNVQIIDKLFNDTGCFQQICTQLETMIPKARYSDKDDDAVLYQYYMR